MGRISRGKGHEELLHAAAMVRAERPEVRFLVVGEASRGEDAYEREVRALHHTLGLEETVLMELGTKRVRAVRVNGHETPFFLDSAQGLAHGKVVFGITPVRIEVICSSTGEATLPEKAVPFRNFPTP